MKVTVEIYNAYNLYLEVTPAELDLLNKLVTRARNYSGYGEGMHLNGDRPRAEIRLLPADYEMAPAPPTQGVEE